MSHEINSRGLSQRVLEYTPGKAKSEPKDSSDALNFRADDAATQAQTQTKTGHTSEVSRLVQVAQARLDETPVVDSSRVALIKQKLAEGGLDFQNPERRQESIQRIVEKMLDFDRNLKGDA